MLLTVLVLNKLCKPNRVVLDVIHTETCALHLPTLQLST